MTASSVAPQVSTIMADLADIPLFSGLAAADLAPLLRQTEVERHADGKILFTNREDAKVFFILLDGHVELYVEDKERTTVIDVAKKSALLGEAALFTDGRHLHSARVAGYAKLLAIPKDPFLAMLDEHFDLAQRMLAFMSIKLRGLVGQIGELKLKSTAQRLAGFLLGLTQAEAGAARVRFPYDKRLAAQSLGMTAESLSRALAQLAPLGVESLAENLVKITDVEALREFCVEESGL